jgi:glutamate--cysteine ligase
LLNRLADRFGWERVYEGENVIALKQGLASISLEPGGQFECARR